MAQYRRGFMEGPPAKGPTIRTVTRAAPKSNNADALRQALSGYSLDDLTKPTLTTTESTTGMSDYARTKADSIYNQLGGLDNYNKYDPSQIRDVGDVQADTVAGSDLSAYTNPYMASREEAIRRQADMDLQGIKNRARASGAASSARAALMESSNREALMRQTGLARADAYESGVAAFQSDAARKLQAALANQGERGTMARFRGQIGVDENARANEQRIKAAQTRNSYLSALPTESRSTQQIAGPSAAAQKIGLALALQGAGSTRDPAVEKLKAKGYSQAGIDWIMSLGPDQRGAYGI